MLQTVESLFIMWKVTGDVSWRERGWTIFQSLERESRTDAGYAALGDVQMSRGPRQDEMPRCVSRISLPQTRPPSPH